MTGGRIRGIRCETSPDIALRLRMLRGEERVGLAVAGPQATVLKIAPGGIL